MRIKTDLTIIPESRDLDDVDHALQGIDVHLDELRQNARLALIAKAVAHEAWWDRFLAYCQSGK